MRNVEDLSEWVESRRVRNTVLRSTSEDGMNGAFILPCKVTGRTLTVLISDGAGWAEGGLSGEPWEHVSVSVRDQPGKCPSWPEMEWVREIFFKPEEWVIQYSPARAEKIDIGNVLHMWRPPSSIFPIPPKVCV